MKQIRKIILLAVAITMIIAANEATSQTILSVKDISGNYGIDPAYLSDTTNFIEYIESLELDNISMAAKCNEVSRLANQMKLSLKNDYRIVGNNIWIDDNTLVNDFIFYEGSIDQLAACASNRSQHYLALEQERMAAASLERQKEAERAEAARLEKLRIHMDSTKSDIESLHHNITAMCDGRNVKDKSRAKDFKSIYYAYLTVYNRYNLAQKEYSDTYQGELDGLVSMQRHLIDSTLSDNSYAVRIEQFPKILKEEADMKYSDVVRSYNKNFLHTAVPITFSTIDEYYQYTRQMAEINRLQHLYITVIGYRRQIDSTSAAINDKYATRYPFVVESYNDLCATTNLTPTFSTTEQAVEFMERVDDMLKMQEIYNKGFDRLDSIAVRADSIYSLSRGGLMDIKASYKKLPYPADILPEFYTSREAYVFDSTLSDFEAVQQCYFKTIALREEIALRHDSIIGIGEGVLKNYYKSRTKKTQLAPQFFSEEGGEEFIQQLNDYINFQKDCLKLSEEYDRLNESESEITAYSKSHPNIYAVYKLAYRSYQASRIANEEQFEQYKQNIKTQKELQRKIVNILRSRDADDIDVRMRKLRDIKKIKELLSLP